MALFKKDTTKEPAQQASKKNAAAALDAAAPAAKQEGAVKKSASAKPAKAKKPSSKAAGGTLTKTPARILKHPRITEKAAKMTMQNGYVFDVAQDATKRDIVAVVKALYGVTPRKVNIVCRAPQAYVSRARNRRGTKAGVKKAYVFLKKGDKIDIAA